MRLEPVIESADTFRRNSYIETLLKLKTAQPELFDLLTDSERLTVKIYAEMKTAYLQAQSAAA